MILRHVAHCWAGMLDDSSCSDADIFSEMMYPTTSRSPWARPAGAMLPASPNYEHPHVVLCPPSSRHIGCTAGGQVCQLHTWKNAAAFRRDTRGSDPNREAPGTNTNNPATRRSTQQFATSQQLRRLRNAATLECTHAHTSHTPAHPQCQRRCFEAKR